MHILYLSAGIVGEGRLTAAQERHGPLLSDLLLGPFTVPPLLGEERVATLHPGSGELSVLREDDDAAEHLGLPGAADVVVQLVLHAGGHGGAARVLEPLDVLGCEPVARVEVAGGVGRPLPPEARAAPPRPAGQHPLEEKGEVVREAEGGVHEMVDPALYQLLPLVGGHVGLNHAGRDSNDFVKYLEIPKSAPKVPGYKADVGEASYLQQGKYESPTPTEGRSRPER